MYSEQQVKNTTVFYAISSPARENMARGKRYMELACNQTTLRYIITIKSQHS
jgi:hypothetical protein